MSPDDPIAKEMFALYEALTPDQVEAITLICIMNAVEDGHANALIQVIELARLQTETLQ